MSDTICWCGNSKLEAFSPDYKHCPVCCTLVCSSSDEDASSDGKRTDFYDQSYWFEYQPGELDYPDIIHRSRQDLSERTLFWLRSLLRFCLPPAKTLELGSAHGGFVALLRQAGFESAGLEVSQWVVEYAEKHFQVPMYLGPVEEQDIESASLDLIILMDVLEHFSDPRSTIQCCLDLLKEDGKLLIQTPEYDCSYSLNDLLKTDHVFIKQLKPIEHVYLFSRRSISQFFNDLDVGYIEFLPPCFPYDMFMVASREPLVEYTQQEIENALLSTPDRRIALALLDTAQERTQFESLLIESDVDRKKRLQNIQKLQEMLAESEADRTSRLKVIQQLEEKLQESETDRSARLDIIQEQEKQLDEIRQDREKLEMLLQESEADRSARLDVIHKLEARLQSMDKVRREIEERLRESEADRAARLQSIERLEERLVESENDRAARLATIQSLERQLLEAETDRADRLEKIVELERSLREEVADHRLLTDRFQRLEKRFELIVESRKHLEEEIAGFKGQIEHYQEEIHNLSELSKQQTQNIHRQAYFIAQYENELSRFPTHLLRRILNKIVRERQKFHRYRNSRSPGKKRTGLKRIAIDLTPVLPGGENGGAKLLATALVWQFSRKVAPECEYFLLTSDDSHDELAWLDAGNTRRICINQRLEKPPKPSELAEQEESKVVNRSTGDIRDRSIRSNSTLSGSYATSRSAFQKITHSIGVGLERTLPGPLYQKIYRFYRAKIKTPKTRKIIKDYDVDLLFCPFTAPFHHTPGVPTVIVVHDLQFKAYPQFFQPEDVHHANFYFTRSCQIANRLICVSDFTRESVLKTADIPPDRVETIHTSFYNPLDKMPRSKAEALLKKYQIEEKKYLLYPANFWPHKNHEMLLTAFRLFTARNPHHKVKLLFTGAPGKRMEFLRQAASLIGLQEKVVFAGFVDEETLSAFFQCSLAVIFPSLYEGFGVPVLEAMSFGVPVLSSNRASLPEVGLDAVHFFDPRKLEEILEAIEAIIDDDIYRQDLVNRGEKRLTSIADRTQWAEEYFRIFEEVSGEELAFTNELIDIYSDHWVGETFEVTVEKGEENRFLELNLEVPDWFPHSVLQGRVRINGRHSRNIRAFRGKRTILRFPLTTSNLRIEVNLNHSASPSAYGISLDDRALSCRVVWCRLITPQAVFSLYEAGV